MNEIINSLAEFLVTPFIRWVLLFAGITITIIQYLNEPQRFSFEKSFEGLTYKWHLYAIAIFTCITTVLTIIGLWITIPFTDKLPDLWYIYLFVLYVAIITQITIDSPEVVDDGSFNPPPTYMYPQKYRVIIAYVGMVIDILVMLQIYIYSGIADTKKTTVISHYVIERFGGWYAGNKLDFLFDWSGLIHVFLKVYLVMLQKNFQACHYNLPASWDA